MSYVRKFEDIRITRWKKGREFNGLPVNSPEFVGDPMREIVEECADGCNYNNVAWNQGKYGKDYWRFQAIDNHLRAAAALAMVDAGVAVAFALAVVDPSQTGLGAGGGLLVWHRGARRADAIDFYARTGSDSAWAQADSAAARQPINARSAGIPGAVTGLLQAHAQ